VRETLRDLQRTAGDCPVVIGRELTKTHEELVRGPISTVQNLLSAELGEFTIVAQIESSEDSGEIRAPSGPELALEFGELTANKSTSRRRAVAALARRHGLAPNDVYAAIEAAKKSG
jgi:16S rRNA (cytidine1402-2'-O)-methyltransferase